MRPPSLSIIAFEMLRPSPVPPRFRRSVASACANFLKTSPRNDSGIPGPLSVTFTRQYPSLSTISTLIVPSSGECLTAFDNRLVRTCIRRPLSPSTRALFAPISTSIQTPNCFAYSWFASTASMISSPRSTGRNWNFIFSDSIFAMLRISSISCTSLWLLFFAIRISSADSSVDFAGTSLSRRESEP